MAARRVARNDYVADGPRSDTFVGEVGISFGWLRKGAADGTIVLPRALRYVFGDYTGWQMRRTACCGQVAFPVRSPTVQSLDAKNNTTVLVVGNL